MNKKTLIILIALLSVGGIGMYLEGSSSNQSTLYQEDTNTEVSNKIVSNDETIEDTTTEDEIIIEEIMEDIFEEEIKEEEVKEETPEIIEPEINLSKTDNYRNKLLSVYNNSSNPYKDSDVILNEIYSDLRNVLPANEMELLKNVQLEWIKEKSGKSDYELYEMTNIRCYELLEFLDAESFYIGTQSNTISQANELSEDQMKEMIYQKMGHDRDTITYYYSPNDNYVPENDRPKYYIFQVNMYSPEDDFEVTYDYNILIDRETHKLYMLSPGDDLISL
ncbi:MAG: hypothetical protein R3Y64_07780 [Peptostreptococcaceae bacterium]